MREVIRISTQTISQTQILSWRTEVQVHPLPPAAQAAPSPIAMDPLNMQVVLPETEPMMAVAAVAAVRHFIIMLEEMEVMEEAQPVAQEEPVPATEEQEAMKMEHLRVLQV